MGSNNKLLEETELTFANSFGGGRGAKKYKLYLNPALAKAGIKDLFEDESITIGK